MADTPRTLAALQTIFANNILGAISPQDERDFLVSVYSPRARVEAFNFAALSFGGSLIVGSNEVSFTISAPCPAGLVVGSKLYISGGVGAAEVVTISAITATDGQTSGTMTFTCVNTHSGAWTVVSATGGLGEAATVHPSKLLELPSGIINLYTLTTLPVTCPGIIGQGVLSSFIYANFTGTSILRFSTASLLFRDFVIIPIAGSMTAGAAIDITAGSVVTLENVNLGGAGGTAGVYIGLKMASGNLFAHASYIIADYRGIELTSCSFDLSAIYVIGNRTLATYIANSAALYLGGGITNGEIHGFWHAAGVFAYGILVDTTAFFINEINIAGLYLDNWIVSGIGVIGTVAGTAASWTISSFRIIDSNAALGNVGFQGIGILWTAAALGWKLSAGFISYAYGYGIAFTGAATDIQFSSVEIAPSQIFAGNQAVNVAAGLVKRLSFAGCHIGIGQSSPGAESTYGFRSAVAIDGLTIVGCHIHADAQDRKIVLAGTETNVLIADNNGIGNIRKTIAAAATITFPVMDREDVIEITGSTAWATAVAGLREGQMITMVWTDAAPGAISQTATMASPGFTPTRFKPYHTMFSNGKLYIG